MRGAILALCLSATSLAASLLAATPLAAQDLRIGHLSLHNDARYVQDWGYARLIVPPPILTAQAAGMAITDLAFVTDAVGLRVTLDARSADRAALADTIAAMVAAGDSYIVLDLPAAEVEAVASAVAGLPVLLINATAPEDSLRSACHGNLIHSGPSLRMQMDTYAQYLRAMDWLSVLVLVGGDPSDAGLAAAFATSAERLRLEIVESRPFTLAANPEQREGNNVKLLTGGSDYDVVFVADTRGEFARFVPYATQLPRAVIGSVGLTALAWHWSMERDGATQVSSRFDKLTATLGAGRKMSSQDWAVWVAVKSVITGVSKTPQADLEKVRDYLKSPRLKLDGSKGVALNYRAWDGQLRMPMLLATGDAVIAIAPLEGYMHAINTLDTLGTDEAEFACD